MLSAVFGKLPLMEENSLSRRAIKRYKKGGVLLLLKYTFWYLRRIYIDYRFSKIREYNYEGVWIDPRQFPLNVKVAIYTGIMEEGTLELIKKHLPNSQPVIELGAGSGIVSCYVSNHIESGVSQLAVEPNQDIIELLKDNARVNNSKFEIINAAWDPENKPVSLKLGNTYLDSNTIHDEELGEKVQGVNLCSLVDLCEKGSISLITNIEGGEFLLIRDEIDTLKKNFATLIIAFHNNTDDSIDEGVSFLKSNGFSHIDTKGNNKFCFKNNKYEND